MVRWLQSVAADLHAEHPDDVHIALVAALFGGFVAADLVMQRARRRFLTPQEQSDTANYIEVGLVSYNALSLESHGNGVRNWKIVPKFHMTTHMGYDQSGAANPRSVHCYPDEDLVGKVKRIIMRCHGATASLRVMQRC